MVFKSFNQIVRHSLERFVQSQDGNIAVIFGIAVIPLISFVGAAIDYSRANAARSSMQAALDSTTLMVAKDLTNGAITTSQISAKAQAYFTALYTNKDAKSIAITANYTAASGTANATILVNGSATINTDFMNIIGSPTMTFGSSSTST